MRRNDGSSPNTSPILIDDEDTFGMIALFFRNTKLRFSRTEITTVNLLAARHCVDVGQQIRCGTAHRYDRRRRIQHRLMMIDLHLNVAIADVLLLID